MTCTGCAATVERALLEVPGVADAAVNLATGRAVVRFDPSRATRDDLVASVNRIGFRAEPYRARSVEPDVEPLGPTLWALALTLPILYFGHLPGHDHAATIVTTVLATALQLGPGRTFFSSAARSLQGGSANMDVLVALGITAAYLYSCLALFLPPLMPMFETAALLILFIRAGKYLEARVRGRARRVLGDLLGGEIDRARRVGAHGEETVALAEVRIGDRVHVLPGERVPLDGTVVEGGASMDESVVTGESAPVVRGPGDPVVSGTLSIDGSLVVQVTAAEEDSFITRVVRLVEEAQADRPPIQRIADRVAARFVPAVVVLSILVFAGWYLGLSRWFPPSSPITPFTLSLGLAVSVLVVACPCALGLATPTAIMIGSGVAFTRGILFRRAQAMEQAARLDTIVLDKTGTVTDGRPSVVELAAARGVTEALLLDLTAAALANSSHPLARAVVKAQAGQSRTPPPVEQFREQRGAGVECLIQGEPVRVGRVDFAGADSPDRPWADEIAGRMACQGRTPLATFRSGRGVGVVGLIDTPRSAAAPTVADLRAMGLRVVLASGDREEVVRATAARIGVTEFHAGMTPEDKMALVNRLKAGGLKVGMVGDGINDAPALAAADLGIALGSGTDVAKETGDLVLVHDDLRDVTRAIRIGRATLAKIRANLFWAFGYNALAIPLAAGALYPFTGWIVPPALCGLLMAVSSITVVGNSLLLRSFDPDA
ncbi:MAG: heavy metal translocating P-type ATPase [Candidatus Riflebacteria bacterium]|nr:heavy metal translocating P-type ATPase [Candidatus Riflebacteria bacterium]